MTGRKLIALSFAICAASASHAAEIPNAVESQAEKFLSLLKAGKGSEAVRSVMASSPLWSQRAGSSEAMAGQIDAAIRAYGPVVSFEKLKTEFLGTMVIREYYLVQHRDMVTRWEFDFVRSGTGWGLGYFGFTDQPNNWFN